MRRVIGLYLAALVAVIGTAALLAKGRPADAHIASAPSELDVAAIQGSGVATGHVLDSTLHAAHVRGAEPVACRQCHEITAQGFAKPDRDRCLGCHPDRKGQIHATVDKPEIRQCTACHDFLATEPTATRAWQCGRCHDKSPHGDQLDMTSDLSQTCGGCHKPHGDRSDAPAQCRKCHADKADELKHRPAGVSETGDCLMCHRQHDKAENAADRCAGCHKDRDPKIPATALFSGGHERCIGCHQPHQFSKATVSACTSCHKNQPVLAADKHGACTTCHDPHDVQAGKSPSVSCARCHEDVHPEHPTSCLGCHPPHAKPPVKYAAACNQCHKTKTDHTQRGCRACHKEHSFALTFGRDQCLGCHQDQQNGLEAVATSNGHANCGNCHGDDPHAPAKPPACANCHKDEGATVPAGHANCQKCHDKHAGGLKDVAKKCTNCHTDRGGGEHASQPCTNCHRQHGPRGVAKPPACTSCHAKKDLPGMHQVAGHATCTGCHVPHQGRPKGDPATCLKCHTDKKDHNAGTSSCIGCHVFRTGDQ